MIKHTDTVKSGKTYTKRDLTKFYRKLFQRGAKINLPDGDVGLYLTKINTMAWVLTREGKGGKNSSSAVTA